MKTPNTFQVPAARRVDVIAAPRKRLEQAAAAFSDAAGAWARNVETLRTVGTEGWQAYAVDAPGRAGESAGG